MGPTSSFWKSQKLKKKPEARHVLDESSGSSVTMPHQPHLAGTVLLSISYLKLDTKKKNQGVLRLLFSIV